jgi:S-adenosylmethionine:tRNA ribosyltransferase-isomerase
MVGAVHRTACGAIEVNRPYLFSAVNDATKMSSKLGDYDYTLPEELIARRPLPRRDESRMMVLHRQRQTIEHRQFSELPALLAPGDLLVLNDTRVVPAKKFSDDGRIEFLFIERLGPLRWKCLAKPGRKMRLGATIKIDQVTARVEEILADGERVILLDQDIDLFAGGSMPLPPYLRRDSDQEDDARYQTVFARTPGAVAAPTAGLHFTQKILEELAHTFVTLHVGTGTFRPVLCEDIREHRMHPEKFSISPEAVTKIDQAQRVVAVGTTSVRVLEAAHRENGKLVAQMGSTDIFIYPPYRFQQVDLLFTNFHLPRSTLLMLVSAFAGREFILHAYEEAIRQRYRFYSYGDCMLIL